MGQVRLVATVYYVNYHNFFNYRLILNAENFLQVFPVRNENDSSPGIAEDVGRLLCCQRRVNGDDNRAQQQGSEVSNGPLRTILAKNRNPIPLGNPPRCQSAADPGYFLI